MDVCMCLGCSGLLWTVLQVLIIFYLSTTINFQQTENPLCPYFYIWPWRMKPATPGSPLALQDPVKNKPSITVLNESILDSYHSFLPLFQGEEQWVMAWLITTLNYQGPHDGLGWGEVALTGSAVGKYGSWVFMCLIWNPKYKAWNLKSSFANTLCLAKLLWKLKT